MRFDPLNLELFGSTPFISKAVILNYTRNPERRFTFELGIDANDDALAAIRTGVAAIESLDFILQEPKPAAMIQTVGDSNIVIWYSGWVNQRDTDFGRGRSLAIHSAKNALEADGFTLPEPTYRVLIDESAASVDLKIGSKQATPEPLRTPVTVDDEVLDTRPDEYLEKMISEEREQDTGADLLDQSKPVE